MRRHVVNEFLHLEYAEDLRKIAAFWNKRLVGIATFSTDRGYLMTDWVEVEAPYRRLGIYTEILRFAVSIMETACGVLEFRSFERSNKATKFWQSFVPSIRDFSVEEKQCGMQEVICVDSSFNITLLKKASHEHR